MRTLWLQIQIFFKMFGTYDGTGHLIGLRDAFWYATHLEWWGL